MKKIFTALFALLFFMSSGIAQPTKLNENFDQVKDLKALKALGWQTYQGNASLEYAVSNDKANSHSASKYASISCKKAGTVYKRDNWLITPQLTVEAGSVFSFWAKSKLPSPTNTDLMEDFNVKVSKLGTSTDDFTITLQEVRSALGDYTRYSYSLTEAPVNLSVGDKIYLAIQSVDFEDEGNSALCIDDVFFGFPSPLLTLNKTVWETSSYQGENISSGNVFTISNTGEGTLSIASITGLEGSPFTSSINATEINLAAYQSYSFSVGYASPTNGIHEASLKITTSDGQSAILTLRGTTKPAPLAVTAIDENFENEFPGFWTIVDGNNNGSSWKISSKSVDNVEPSLKSLICEQTATEQNEWLISPKIKVVKNQVLNFMAKTQFDNHADIINLRVSKTGKNIGTDFTITVGPITVPNEWSEIVHKIADFSGIAEGDEVYVAIQVVSPGITSLVPGKLTLDNFKVYATDALVSEKAITGCSVNGQVGETVIDPVAYTVIVKMPYGYDLTTVSPVFAVSPKASVNPAVVQNFSTGSVEYTVTAEDKSTQKWMVFISCMDGSKEANITSFKVGDKEASIDAEAATVILELPADANLSSVTPIIVVSTFAKVVPTSGVAVDFSQGGVVYSVTAQNGTIKKWFVKVTKPLPPAVEGLFEGFEAGVFPENWIAIDLDGNKKSWKVMGNAKFEGKYGIKTYSNKTGNDDWLISPRVKVRAGDILSFMYRSASVDTKESFNVKVSKTGREIADFGITLSEVKDASAEYGFTKYEYKLTDKDDIKIGDEISIAIQVVSVNCMELHLDNISIAPAPIVPKAEINMNQWRSVCKIDANQTSEKSFILTNTLAGTLNVTKIILPEGFSTSIDQSNVALAAGESYSFSVAFAPKKEGVCEDDLVIETNGGSVSIALSGYGVAKAAYHEGFEIEATYSEWETLDNDGDGNNWFPYQNTDQAPDLAHSGLTCIVSESALLKGGPATPDNWLITPRLSVETGQKMFFWVGTVSDLSFRECYSVKISSTDKKLTSFTTLLDKSVLSTNGWSMVEVDLAAYAGKNVYIAIEHHNVSDESQIIFDDFILPALYEAATPDLAISVARLENTQIPLAQADFKFKVKVKNRGAELKERARVQFSSSESSVIENQDLIGPFAKGSEVILESKVSFIPTAIGNYSFSFEAILANDDNQEDNIVKLPVAVTDTVLAKDNGTFDNFIGLGKTLSGIVGQRFALNKKATITSVSFFVVGPKEPTEISAGVYAFANTPGELLAESNSITVSTEGWHTVVLSKPITMEKGNFFIGLKEGLAQSLNLGINQNIPATDNCFINIDNTWVKAEDLEESLNITLMIRGNFGPVQTTGISKTTVDNVLVYPNPASEVFALRNVNNATVQIFNTTGVQCLILSNVSENEQINISSLTKGVYFVKIVSAIDRKSQVIKLLVQ